MILDLISGSSKNINTGNVDDLVKTYRNLNIEQSITAMRANQVADAEIKAALASQKYSEADIAQAMATKSSNTAIQTNTALTKANTVMKKAGTIATGLFNAALTAGVSIIVTMIATGFVEWLSDVANKEEDLTKAAEESKTKIDELNNSFINQKNTVKEYAKEYAELAQ